MSKYLPGKVYRIINAHSIFGGHMFDEEVVDYHPTGKYRIYEDGHMAVEFTVTFRRNYWYKNDTFRDVTRFIYEGGIVFKPGYTEYDCNED